MRLLWIALFAISVSAANKQTKAPTFSKDIAPIVFRHCGECHRPGEGAPFSVLTYKEVRPWAKAIRQRVLDRTMPPWHADPAHGQFKNDRRMPQADIDAIVAWVDSAALEGNPKDLPPAPRFVEGWSIGQPDAVFALPKPYTVAASGPDEYQYFEVPTNFSEDKWVSAIEARPGNRKVVHHVVVWISPPPAPESPNLTPGELVALRVKRNSESIRYIDGFLRRTKADAPVHNDGCALPNGGGGSRLDTSRRDASPIYLTEWAPGRNPDVFQPGTAKKIPAGSKLTFQVHYNKTAGSVQTDQSSIGFVFAKEPPKELVTTELVFNGYMQIPAQADRHRATACWTIDRDMRITTIMPHMHVRGIAARIEAVYPDGRKETLLNVPRYNFAWQTGYRLSQPLHLPKGTTLHTTGWFDNSANNPYNPDPTKAIRWGDPTYDEMLAFFIDYTEPVKLDLAAR